jgi:hypothetical protein
MSPDEIERVRLTDELEGLRREREELLEQRTLRDAKDMAVSDAVRRHDEEIHTADQDRHLAVINGSIEHTVAALLKIETRLGTIEEADRRREAVSLAVEQHLELQQRNALSQRTMWIGVATLLIGVASVLIYVLVR